MIGIEDRVWVQVGAEPRVFAIADEDLDRENDVKTSAVHFLRFELSSAMRTALFAGAGLAIGVDHPAYPHTISRVAEGTERSLIGDLTA
jgi:hypothetical protein